MVTANYGPCLTCDENMITKVTDQYNFPIQSHMKNIIIFALL